RRRIGQWRRQVVGQRVEIHFVDRLVAVEVDLKPIGRIERRIFRRVGIPGASAIAGPFAVTVDRQARRRRRRRRAGGGARRREGDVDRRDAGVVAAAVGAWRTIAVGQAGHAVVAGFVAFGRGAAAGVGAFGRAGARDSD